MKCLPCNLPCKNCVQHPSKCLTCHSGNFFEYKCLDVCPIGTFSDNGICKFCSFKCKACLGSEDTCIACSKGKFLFNGACLSTCPIELIKGKCPNRCPNGYFTTSDGSCLRCSPKCTSCADKADFCTKCRSGVSFNGICVPSCPSNSFL